MNEKLAELKRLRQLALEQETITSGAHRFMAAVADAQATGRGSETTYGLDILRLYVDDTSRELTATVKRFMGKPGVHPLAIHLLNTQDHRVMSYIALKVVINSLHKNYRCSAVEMAIGGRIEDEIRFSRMEEEASIQAKAEGRSSSYFDSTLRKIAKQGKNLRRDKKRALKYAQEVAPTFGNVLSQWEPFADALKLSLGKVMVGVIIRATSAYDKYHVRLIGSGLIEPVKNTVMTDGKLITESQYTATMKTEALIRGNINVMQFMNPPLLPMVCPPNDWESATDGGFLRQELQAIKPMIKCSAPGHLHKYNTKEYAGQLPDLLNMLQAVPLEINTFVLDQALQEIDSPYGVGMPPAMIAVPESPLEDISHLTKAEQKAWKKVHPLTDTQKAQYIKWIEAKRKVEFKNKARISRLKQLSSIIALAERFRYEDELHMVWTADFRFRVYAACSSLSPQSVDLSKALLQFRNAVALGANGWKHLLVYTAGEFGYDKVSLQERMNWCECHMEEILITGSRPEETRSFWGQADSPYIFLGCCREIYNVTNWVQSGNRVEDYKSHLVIHQDGKCNGLQHLAAILRDPVTAKAVSLEDSDVPSSIYTIAAAEVNRLLDLTYSQANNLDKWVIDQWRLIGIDKSCVKQPVMVVPYGGTSIGCKDQIRDWWMTTCEEEERKGNFVNPFLNDEKLAELKEMAQIVDLSGTVHKITEREAEGESIEDLIREIADTKKRTNKFSRGVAALEDHAIKLLHNHVWEALKTVVIEPRRALEFLCKIVSAVQKGYPDGTPIVWGGDDGLAILDIRNTEVEPIKTMLDGQILTKLRRDLHTLDKRAMRTGIAPDVVHKRDATHLIKTAMHLKDKGINDIVPIHDSYGVHAGNTDALHRALRVEFVKMYSGNYLLEFWLEQAKQHPQCIKDFPDPDTIQQGDFDINKVLTSTFFFR